mgnify:CR=1 FL=1
MANTIEKQDGDGALSKVGDQLSKVGEQVQDSQVWSSIFRPGSIFRKGYTDSPRNRSYVIMNSVLYHLLSLIHISEPTRLNSTSRMPSSA